MWQEWPRVTNAKNEFVIGRIIIKADIKKNFQLARTLEILQYTIENIKDIARHELQHFMQSFIKHITGKHGGLPSNKIRDLEYDQENYSNVGVSNEAHVLDDHEFYTNLTDSVNDFNRYKKFIPVSLHRDYMLSWVRHVPVQRFFDLMEQKIIPIFKNNIKTKSLKTKEQKAMEWDNIIDQSSPATDMLNMKNMFNVLKQYNPNKYRKAVAEFSKAVGL